MPLRRRSRRSLSSSKRGSRKSREPEEEEEEEEVSKVESEGESEEVTGGDVSPSRDSGSRDNELDSNEEMEDPPEEEVEETSSKQGNRSKLGKRSLPLLSFSIQPVKRLRVTLLSLKEQNQSALPLDPPNEEESSSDSEEEYPRENQEQFTRAILQMEMAEWIEKSLNESLRQAKEKYNEPNQSKAHLSVEERLLFELVNGSHLYPAEDMEDLKPTLKLRLFKRGFSIGDQMTLHPYNSETEVFLRAIDQHRMPPDLLELLEEVPCSYYDGCLIVSVEDHRFSDANPQRRHILLRPDQESISYELERAMIEHEKCQEHNLIEAEARALLAMNIPVCLDPSPRVAVVNNMMNYNRNKFARWDKSLQLKPPTEAAIPRIYYETLSQMAHQLDKKNKSAPTRPALLEGLRLLASPFSRNLMASPVPIAPSNIDQMTVEPSEQDEPAQIYPPLFPQEPMPYDPATAILVQKDSLRFSRANGTKFVHFELEKCPGMGYSASLRMGSVPDMNTNGGITRFHLRDAETVSRTISTLNAVIRREGGHLVNKDSELRKPGALRSGSSSTLQKVPVSPGRIGGTQ